MREIKGLARLKSLTLVNSESVIGKMCLLAMTKLEHHIYGLQPAMLYRKFLLRTHNQE